MLGNKEKNFISAVIYCYNNSQTIKNFVLTVDEVLNQNFEKYEIICVNDCSKEDIQEQLKQICEEQNVKSMTVVNTSFFQGVENAMIAGGDIAIGDFVLEFDSTVLDFDKDMIMRVYKKSLEGNDIVFASPDCNIKFSSKIFYKLFNNFSDLQYKIKTQRFSIISRRGINRVKSMGVKTVYRKAVYASCGLSVSDISYTPIKGVLPLDTQKGIKKDLAANSLILFTNVAYKISVTLSVIMAAILLFAGLYTVAVFVSASPVAGWTTTMLVMSFGFFGLFVILAFVLKYLSIILNLIFSHKQYVIESVTKITK